MRIRDKVILRMGFPDSSAGKESTYNVEDTGDTGLIPGLGKFPGEGNGNPLQDYCLENPTDRGAWLGYSPWGRKESDTTERLHYHYHKLPLLWTSCYICCLVTKSCPTLL